MELVNPIQTETYKVHEYIVEIFEARSGEWGFSIRRNDGVEVSQCHDRLFDNKSKAVERVMFWLLKIDRGEI